MFRKIFYLLLFSSTFLLALETGDSIPQKTQQKLNLEVDKLYVVDFFASWCKSCKKELPLIEAVHKKNIANIIGINVDKKEEKGKAFVEKLALSFPIVYDNNQELINIFEPLGFPTLYYIKDGKILKTIVGAVAEIDKQIEADVQELK